MADSLSEETVDEATDESREPDEDEDLDAGASLESDSAIKGS